MDLVTMLLCFIVFQLIVVHCQLALKKDKLKELENEISSLAVPRR